MKPLALLVFAALSANAAEIPAGAHLLLKMVNSVSTRTAKAGDQVYLQTASPIAADGRILVPVGAYVQGTVAESKRSGRVKGRAEIALHLETLTLASGQAFKIAPHLDSVDPGEAGPLGETGQKVDNEGAVKQSGTKLQDTGRIAILAGTGAAIGGIAARSWSGAGIGGAAGGAVGFATTLLTRGKEVDLNAGSTLDVVFDRSLPLE
jgi:type IV secretion system protein VirB10